MDATQIERWKELAQAMCFQFWPEKTEARKRRLWREIESFIDELSPYEITRWEDEPYPCDWFEEFFDDYGWDIAIHRRGEIVGMNEHYSRFFNQLRCIARASIGMITETGGMVWGFSVGDLKRLFDGEIPAWALAQYDELDNDTPEHIGIAL